MNLLSFLSHSILGQQQQQQRHSSDNGGTCFCGLRLLAISLEKELSHHIVKSATLAQYRGGIMVSDSPCSHGPSLGTLSVLVFLTL